MTGRAGWAGAAAMVLAGFVVIGLLAEALAPAPQGPPLSSFSTTPEGVAGWAELLQRAGHPVSQVRTPLAQERLRTATTLIVLASAPLAGADAAGLARFVRRGGRLVIAGPGARGFAGGPARVLGSPAPLENRNLARGDNAELSLQLAGPPGRPVAFAEAIHGYGPATGLAAFPGRWRVSIALLTLAAALFVVARGRRLGGPDPLPVSPPSPRSAYVEAMAGILSATAERTRLDQLAVDPELPGVKGGRG